MLLLDGRLDEYTLGMQMLRTSIAVPPEGTLGRPVAEPADDFRTPFQRDRGRIVHAQAFRRLQGKTQVFVAGEGDHFRTRLTHTMEVSQIARDMARTLGLNEDLAECIALAHDLGHPPFGHMGEAALDAWMRQHGSTFEHNEQSLRIVTLLEEHSPTTPGLNLNREVLEGLQKHGARENRDGRSLSLEAEVVNIADEIAYLGHDTEDGLRAGLFSMSNLSSMPLVMRAVDQAKRRQTSLRGALIDLLVRDVYAQTESGIKNFGLHSLEEVYRTPTTIVCFSELLQQDVTLLRAFLAEHMYGHPRVREANRQGQGILTQLCDKFFAAPTEKILGLQRKTGSTLAEAVKDYVAGMTDAFARAQFGK